MTNFFFCFSPDQECQQIFKANYPIDTETIKTKVRQENKKHLTRVESAEKPKN